MKQILPDIVIQNSKDSTIGICDEIFALASSVYPPDVVISPTLLRTWHSANSGIFWTARRNSNLVGYMKILPLKKEAFLRTIKTDFDEKQIKGTELTENEGLDELRLFISSIVVHPSERVRETQTSRKLRIAFLEHCINCEQRGSKIIEISGEAVTEKGNSMLESLGLARLCKTTKNSQIYYTHGSISIFTQSLNSIREKMQKNTTIQSM